MKSIAVLLFGTALVCASCRGEDEEANGLPAGTGGVGDGGWPDSGSLPDGAVPDGAAGDDDAEIVSAAFPAVLACSESAAASVQVKNTGTSTWTSGDGYKLGAVDDSDPFSSEPRILLPQGTVVAPGATWQFELSLVAPGQTGSHLSDWRMVREDVAWFGQTAASTVGVDCAPKVPTPYKLDVVQQVASDYAHLLQTNTWESCGEFVQRVLVALNDPDWGHVGKTAGEGQYSPPGFSQWVDGHLLTGFSHDVIWHKPSNQQVDIIVNAAANSDANPAIHGPASVAWHDIDPIHYRENNPWLAAIPP